MYFNIAFLVYVNEENCIGFGPEYVGCDLVVCVAYEWESNIPRLCVHVTRNDGEVNFFIKDFLEDQIGHILYAVHAAILIITESIGLIEK